MENPGVIAANKPDKRQEMSHTISVLFSKYGIFLIFAVMILVASLLSPAFVSSTNLINIVRQMSIVGLIALGVTGIIVSAGIDLSSGSVVGLTAVVAASLAQMPDYSAAFYPGLHLPLIAPILGQGDVFGIPVPIIILVVMAAVTHILYAHTKFGKYIYAIGGNEQAARVSGINASRYKMLIYVYASFLAGLAGLVVSSRIGSGQPGLGVGYELDAIAAAVIGGTSLSAGGIGTVAGTIVGALIIGVLNNTLDLMNVSAFWQQIVKGCIIVGAVILDQLKNRGGK
jgi:inositol transport system permease protein